jgi:hypothetical protein
MTMEHIDFYDGRGEDAEWLGTLSATDASPTTLGLVELFSPENPDNTDGLFTREDYRRAVSALLEQRLTSVTPQAGWPHAHTDSVGTTYSACWKDGAVWIAEYGHVFLVVYSNGFREPSKFPAFTPRPAAGT